MNWGRILLDGIAMSAVFNLGVAVFWMRSKLLEVAGFHVFSKWTAQEFPRYVHSFQFAIADTKQMGSTIAPLLYMAARKRISGLSGLRIDS